MIRLRDAQGKSAQCYDSRFETAADLPFPRYQRLNPSLKATPR